MPKNGQKHIVIVRYKDIMAVLILLFTEMWCYVVCYTGSKLSQEHTIDLEDGGGRFHQNTGIRQPIVHGITNQLNVMLILTAVRISLSDMYKDPVWTSHAIYDTSIIYIYKTTLELVLSYVNVCGLLVW
jgi:hypothetical protein